MNPFVRDAEIIKVELALVQLQKYIALCITNNHPIKWVRILPLLEKISNSTEHASHPLHCINPDEPFTSLMQCAVEEGVIDPSVYIFIREELTIIDDLMHKFDLTQLNPHFDESKWCDMVGRISTILVTPVQ